MKKVKVGILGYGQFGRFMAKHLRPYATIVPIEKNSDPAKLKGCTVVIFAVPYYSLSEAIKTVSEFITPKTLLLDVTSVKQEPLALIQKSFPNNQLLGTHPIFGPQSGKHGIEGLPIVLSNVSFSKTNYAKVKRFLKQTLKLKILEQSPLEHDIEMARVQALTHMIGQLLKTLDIKSYPTNTKSYEQLLELKDLLRDDSWELFETIQNANPEAKKIRHEFTKAVKQIETKLKK